MPSRLRAPEAGGLDLAQAAANFRRHLRAQNRSADYVASVGTGLRLSELAGLTLDTVDIGNQLVEVIGKGKRGRLVPFGVKAARALERYETLRRRHKQSALPAFWLSQRGAFSNNGIYEMLKARAARAGIGPIWPHRFRHTFASNWLNGGGQGSDLMRITGWRSTEMLLRYTEGAATELAIAAHRKHAPGDRF